MSFYKKITVPLPKFREREEKYGIDEPSCFINSNRVPKHNGNFSRIDFEEREKKKAQQDKAQQDKAQQDKAQQDKAQQDKVKQKVKNK